MFRKNYFSLLVAVALFLTGSLAVFAQTAPVRGKVELKKADGTTEPVAGATVEVFRTDSKGKLSPTKTGKKGEFAFAGFVLGQTFALSVSAPNIKPEVYPNIKGGMENITITVVSGDGKRLTEEEVRQSLTAAPAAKSQAPSGNAKSAEPTPDQKKAMAEQAKQQAEYDAKKKNAENTFAIVKKALEEGSKAHTEKNYDLAIVKYDEGIAAQPDFEGSTPVLLNNKAIALINRATSNYNLSVKGDPAAKAAAMESVKKDFQNAVASSDRALEILSKAAPSTDAETQKKYAMGKFEALRNRKEAYRLMSKTGADRTKAKEVLVAFQEYIAAESDAKLKSDAQLALGITLQDANDFDQAIVEFEKVLSVDPNNIDALSGVGFSLINVGYINNDKVKLQEGANYLQKFADLAPDTNQYKADAKGIIETLKKEQNVAPQKGAGKAAPRKKP